MLKGQTDGQTDGRQTVTLRFLLDAACVTRAMHDIKMKDAREHVKTYTRKLSCKPVTNINDI